MQVTIVDSGIWRGPEPVTAADKAQLQSLGVKYTLDLETGSRFCDGSPLAETLWLNIYGIRVLSHPLGAILPPTKSELSLAAGVMKSFGPLYVHCKAGVDRTGMVCAWYRMHVQGWSYEDAIAEMAKLGTHKWYYWWMLFL